MVIVIRYVKIFKSLVINCFGYGVVHVFVHAYVY